MDASIQADVSSDKRCPGCDTVRALGEYHRCRTTRDGLQVYCKSCRAGRRKRPDYTSTRRAWYGRVSAVLNARRRNDVSRKEAINAKYRERLATDPEFAAYRRSLTRKSYRRNPELFIRHVRIREGVERLATPAWADLDMIAAFYRDAQALKDELGTEMHVDHIVPLRGKNVCGLHVEDNLRIVEARVNMSKGNRLVPELLEAA